MATEMKCPHCGKPVPATALGGICPECMLKAGLADTGEVGPDGTLVAKAPPPSIPRIEDIAPHFPQLEILACLGRGGMGAVYKARQPKLDRLVALKILTRSRDSGITDTEFAARFQQEARTLARLSHPDIVAVYDFGEAGGFHYLLMEFVDGLTLRQLLQTRKLSPEEALGIVPKICEALQFAHERGIVHRDIKPENILLDKRGQLKIADFGIAKILGSDVAAQALTGVKDRLGTPHYMAPEQIEKPAKVDHRADIYSLGVVFYEMLTGELPLGKFQPPSRKVHVDVRLDEVVLHALEKEPDRRYQHASEVKTDVETIAGSVAGDKPQAESFQSTADVPPQNGALNRPLPWTLSAWAFIVIGLVAVMGTLAMLYKRPFSFALYPGLAHLFAGVALLTLSRAWRHFAVILLAFMTVASAYMATVFAISPGGRGLVIMLPVWLLKPISLAERPDLGAAAVLGIALVLGWPYYMFFSRTGRRLFAKPPSARVRPLAIDLERARSLKSEMDPRLLTLAPWIAAVRWTARVLGTLLLLFYGVFILAEGLPPIATQPEGVQLNFVALGLMLAGFAVGWKREGAAALLIASGWTLWQISENAIRWNLFQTPLPVALLYGFCWWATRGRKTGVVAMAVVVFVFALGLGRVLVPTNIFVRGIVRDAQSGQPIPNAELRLPSRSTDSNGKSDRPNTRAGQDGRFTLYVGWLSDQTPVTISASGYQTLTTGFGPRSPHRSMLRDFHLQPVGFVLSPSNVPPVVVETIPASGASGVDSTLSELRVTFSKSMRDGGWSWVKLSDGTFPAMTATPRFLPDERTCVLPVKLQPGKLYAVWINFGEARNFQDADGRAALPYLLIFQTSP